MHIVRAGVVAAALIVVACSSDEDPSSGPPCAIAGTYRMVGRIQQKSAGCAAFGNDAPETTVTVTAAKGGGYLLEFAGLTGTCFATTTDACALQAKCDLSTPGTIQVAWRFLAEGGFSGTNVGSLSASATLSEGCNYTVDATGRRL